MYRLVKESGMELGVLITKKFNQVDNKINTLLDQTKNKFHILFRTSGPLATSSPILSHRGLCIGEIDNDDYRDEDDDDDGRE